MGVGGGALGKSLPYWRGEISLSVPEDRSSSQESAMVEACCLGTALRVLWEEDERERPLRADSTSAVVNNLKHTVIKDVYLDHLVVFDLRRSW